MCKLIRLDLLQILLGMHTGFLVPFPIFGQKLTVFYIDKACLKEAGTTSKLSYLLIVGNILGLSFIVRLTLLPSRRYGEGNAQNDVRTIKHSRKKELVLF